MQFRKGTRNSLSPRRIWVVAAVALAIGNYSIARAQSASDVIGWTASVAPQSVKPGGSLTVTLTGTIAESWHMYSITQPPGGPTRTSIWLPNGQPFKVAGALSGSEPETIFDPNFGINTEVHTARVVYRLPVAADKELASGKHNLTVNVRLQLCTSQTCLPPTTMTVTAAVMVAGQEKAPAAAPKVPAATPKPTAPAGSAPQQLLTGAPSGGVGTAPPNSAIDNATSISSSTEPAKAPTSSLGSFLWLAMAMGALSLLTPCVFPMVPITVSYFSNHGSGSRRGAILHATIYGVGIVLTFSALGLALALIFGAGGVNQLAANPWINLLITAIFFAFAFSLFGAYFIQVPPSLMQKMDSLTRSKEGSRVVGALLMGFTFTLTSFTCTAPFVGTLLVMASRGNWRWPLAGMLAYSTVFALPFFVLALAPQLISQLPRAGSWMNSVKVVMGFLEIAAAMKFLSNADLVWHWGIFTRETVLAIWIACGLAVVLYVFGLIRFEHDSKIEHVGAIRLTTALTFLAITIALVPGLFGKRLGELDSFLPPASSELGVGTKTVEAASGETQWILNDYDGALAQAKQQNKLVFIDFTGYTCTNCRWMEANMFPKPEVKSELNKFVTVRLYTDGTGAVFEKQQKMQQEKFGTVALPLYAIVRPDGSVITTFPGLTRKPEEFVRFLQRGTNAL